MLVVCSLERIYNISINTGNNTLSLMHVDNKDEYDDQYDDDDDDDDDVLMALMKVTILPS